MTTSVYFYNVDGDGKVNDANGVTVAKNTSELYMNIRTYKVPTVYVLKNTLNGGVIVINNNTEEPYHMVGGQIVPYKGKIYRYVPGYHFIRGEQLVTAVDSTYASRSTGQHTHFSSQYLKDPSKAVAICMAYMNNGDTLNSVADLILKVRGVANAMIFMENTGAVPNGQFTIDDQKVQMTGPSARSAFSDIKTPAEKMKLVLSNLDYARYYAWKKNVTYYDEPTIEDAGCYHYYPNYPMYSEVGRTRLSYSVKNLLMTPDGPMDIITGRSLTFIRSIYEPCGSCAACSYFPEVNCCLDVQSYFQLPNGEKIRFMSTRIANKCLLTNNLCQISGSLPEVAQGKFVNRNGETVHIVLENQVYNLPGYCIIGRFRNEILVNASEFSEVDVSNKFVTDKVLLNVVEATNNYTSRNGSKFYTLPSSFRNLYINRAPNFREACQDNKDALGTYLSIFDDNYDSAKNSPKVKSRKTRGKRGRNYDEDDDDDDEGYDDEAYSMDPYVDVEQEDGAEYNDGYEDFEDAFGPRRRRN